MSTTVVLYAPSPRVAAVFYELALGTSISFQLILLLVGRTIGTYTAIGCVDQESWHAATQSYCTVKCAIETG